MADLGTTTAPDRPERDPGPADHDVGRRVTRRRTLPGGRAVVGALLITLAVIGVFAAWLSATAAPSTRYAVVDVDLAPGDEITLGDLRLVAMDLPAEQAAAALADAQAAVGSVALAPLRAGDLLVASAIRQPDAVPGTSRFSFALPASQALAGDLQPGDRADVLATDDATTGFVATDLAVVAAEQDGSEVVVTVAVNDPTLVLALAHAVDEASVHLALANPRQPAGDTLRRDSFGPATDAPADVPAATPTPAPAPTAGPATPSVDGAPDGTSDGAA